MPEDVVHFLETVEIDAEHGEAPGRTDPPAEGRREPLVERRPIGKIGERVVMRQMRDALLGAFALCDVVDHGHHELRNALSVFQQLPVDGDDPRFSPTQLDGVVVEEELARPQQLLVFLPDQFSVIGGIDRIRRLSEDIDAGHADEVFGGAIEHGEPATVHILHQDRVRNAFDHQMQKLPRTPQFVRHSPVFGNVAGDAELGLCDRDGNGRRFGRRPRIRLIVRRGFPK